jgi:hypothetical protein
VSKLSEINNSKVATVGSDIGQWQSYTPTTTGLGTVSDVQMQWRRVGESVEIKGDLIVGTATATELQVGLPNSYTIDFIAATDTISVGTFEVDASPGIVGARWIAIATNGDTFINMGMDVSNANNNTTTAVDGNNIGNNRFIITASVPVLEFKNAGVTSGLPVATTTQQGILGLDEAFKATETTYGLVKATKFQTKKLTSEVTTTTADISDLKFNNLVVGRMYQVQADIYMSSGNQAETTKYGDFNVTHDGDNMISVYHYKNNTSVSSHQFILRWGGMMSKPFVATATTIICSTNQNGSTYIYGNPAGQVTNVTLMDVTDQYVTTTDWT